MPVNTALKSYQLYMPCNRGYFTYPITVTDQGLLETYPVICLWISCCVHLTLSPPWFGPTLLFSMVKLDMCTGNWGERVKQNLFSTADLINWFVRRLSTLCIFIFFKTIQKIALIFGIQVPSDDLIQISSNSDELWNFVFLRKFKSFSSKPLVRQLWYLVYRFWGMT